MTKALTFDEVVSKARQTHGEKYAYLTLEFQQVGKSGLFRYIRYICPAHGEILQRQDSHLKGLGCKSCARDKIGERSRKPFEVFASQAIKVLPGYTFLSYSSPSKYKAICNQGHSYEGIVGNTLANSVGCNICKPGKHTLETAKRLAVSKHGSLYTYLSLEKEGRAKIRFICPEHGEQSQNLQSHLKSGCPKCSRRKVGLACTMPEEDFKLKATKLGSKLSLVEGTYIASAVRAKFVCENGHETYKTPADILHRNSGCKMCSYKISGPNKEIHETINQLGAEALLEQKVHGFSVDVWSQKLNLAIDYHGLIWHSSRFRKSAYDLKKDYYRYKDLTEKGVRNIQLFSDEWYFRNSACKTLLGHITGKLDKVGARKLRVASISREEAVTFLNQFHIQGAPLDTQHCYGLLNSQDELFSVATFTKALTRRGTKAQERTWELTRFASKVSVQGGFGKIFNYFIKDKNPKVVFTYSDNRMFTGKMYQLNNFVKSHETYPDYFYFQNTKNAKRIHKSRFQKSRLQALAPPGVVLDLSRTEKELTEQLGYYRIYDCGKTAWVWKASS